MSLRADKGSLQRGSYESARSLRSAIHKVLYCRESYPTVMSYGFDPTPETRTIKRAVDAGVEASMNRSVHSGRPPYVADGSEHEAHPCD